MSVLEAGRLGVVKLWILIEFLMFFGWELTRANIKLAIEIMTPGHHMRPGIVIIPLDTTNDIQSVLLANLVSLTPGTLSLDVSADRRRLYVYAMYLTDIDAFRRTIKKDYERRVINLLSTP